MGYFLKNLSACAAVIALSSSCTPTGVDGFIRRTTSAANDHIMYVRKDPETFGHKRLSALAEAYFDLGFFLKQQNFPDFVAETNKSGNRYLVLYYLSRREAFACRTGAGNSRQVEFSGPYPVTDGEFATLKTIRDNASSTMQDNRRGFSRTQIN